jgi:hypothetical protein
MPSGMRWLGCLPYTRDKVVVCWRLASTVSIYVLVPTGCSRNRIKKQTQAISYFTGHEMDVGRLPYTVGQPLPLQVTIDPKRLEGCGKGQEGGGAAASSSLLLLLLLFCRGSVGRGRGELVRT